MNHKKELPQDSRVNEVSANCWEWPDDDLVPVDLSTYDLYSERLRTTYAGLVEALRTSKIK